ncbi:MAG TPA: site-specific integrase [Candidatus Blautia excrementipullorum]|nr:site-specific integrase [Candidatus Blautia excrementipullorum]
MWVEETKQGKYKYIERFTDPLTGKYRRVSIVLDKNTRQAQKQAQAALQEKMRVSSEPKKKEITLSELLELYKEEKKVTTKASSYHANIPRIKKAIEIIGDDVFVEKLTSGYIRNKLIATGEKASTINGRISKIKEILRWGYKNDYIHDISYLDKLEKLNEEKTQAEKLEDKFLESEDAIRLVRHIRNRKWRNFTEFLLLSGLRYGEAAALLQSDLDFSNRVIHVTKNYDDKNKLISTPKSSASNREVYMQMELYVLCKRIIADSVSGTVIPIQKNGLLFCQDNHPLGYEGYCAYLKRASLKTLGREITPHVLRHTHASLMMEHGMSVEAITRRLGHTDSRITSRIYLHVTNRLREKENDQINNIRIL